MSNILKWIFTVIITAMICAILYGVYILFNSNYIWDSPLVAVVGGAFGIVVVVILIKVMTMMHNVSLLMLLALCTVGLSLSCDRAKPNQQVLISNDCGVTYRKLDTADMIPSSIAPCFIKIVVPNSSMQSDTKFTGNFANKVKVGVDIDADYEIRDAIAYIRTARYLGGMSKGADDEEGHNDAVFEALENKVIDKRIREAAKAVLLQNDVVNYDQGDLEDTILEEVNKLTEKIGIHVNFIALTLSMGPQTEQAVDAAVAMQIYNSQGMADVGKALILAKAGASQVNVNTRVVVPKSEE